MNLLPSFVGAPEVNRVYHTDLFTLCDAMPARSVDMILMDLPYGTTACAWDTVIPFEPMWARLKRIIKPRGAIVLTASQPFTSALVMSNIRDYSYSWQWIKTRGTNFANAKKQPIRLCEDVAVFKGGNYYPQNLKRVNRVMRNSRSTGGGIVRGQQALTGTLRTAGATYVQEFEDFPDNVLYFGSVETPIHPTQKPVALFEYLIRTYTREGELVFDGVVGSGTTAVAARNCKRNFICGDRELDYVLTARDRLRMPFEARQKPVINDVSDLPLFASATS